MKCTRCQTELAEGMAFCPNCGQAVNGNNQWNQQQGYAQYRGPMPLPPHIKNSLITLLVFSLIELCCCNQLGGGIGLLFTYLARESFQQGDFVKYENRRKYAIYALIGGVILTALCGGLYVGLIGFGTAVGL